jgi:hypothetical protein
MQASSHVLNILAHASTGDAPRLVKRERSDAEQRLIAQEGMIGDSAYHCSIKSMIALF